MLAEGIQLLINSIGSLAEYLLLLLPESPFRELPFDLRDNDFVALLSWLLPIQFAITSTAIWLTAVVTVYPLVFIMRKLNLLK
jgi:hypothetical protein